MSNTKHDVSLIIKAHDEATAPMARMMAKLREFKVLDPIDPKKHELEKKKHTIQNAFREIGAAGKELGAAFFEVGAKVGELLAIGGGVAFVELIHGSIEAGQNLEKISHQLGVSVDYYAQLSHAANMADVSQEEFTSSMQKFAVSLGAAHAKGGPLYKFLMQVGPVFADQVRHAKSVPEAFDLIAKAMAKLKNPTDKARLATAAFGKQSIQMLALLEQGPEKIHETMEEYLHLAGSQEEFAKAAVGTEDALKLTKTAFEGLRNAAAAELLPALTEVAEVAKEFFVEHRAEIKAWAHDTAGAIKDWVQGGGLKRLAEDFGALARAVGWVIDKLGPVGTMAVALVPVWGPIASGVWELGAAFGALGKAALAAKAAMAAAKVAAAASGAAGGAAGAAGSGAAATAAGAGATGVAAATAGAALAATAAMAVVTAFGAGVADIAKGWKQGEKTTLGSLVDWMTGHGRNVDVNDPDSADYNINNPGAQMDRPLTPGELAAVNRGLSAAGALPVTGGPQQAKVVVDFQNMPKGARATIDRGSTADLEISTGPAMASP